MKFIVEVPTYLRVEVDAPDAVNAAAAAENLVAQREYIDLLHGGTFVTDYGETSEANLLLLEEGEDRTPDVYVCQDGKLALVEDSGSLVTTDDSCGYLLAT